MSFGLSMSSRAKPRPSADGRPRIFQDAMSRASSDSSKTGRKSSGVVGDLKDMREGDGLEDHGFGGRTRQKSSHNAEASSSTSNVPTFPPGPSKPKSSYDWDSEPVPILKPTAVRHGAKNESNKPPRHSARFQPGLNTLDEKPAPGRGSLPNKQHRNAGPVVPSGASSGPSWGIGRVEQAPVHKKWMENVNEIENVANDPRVTSSSVVSTKSRPPSSSASSSLRPPRSDPPRSRPRELESSPSGEPLASPPRNTTAGPSKAVDGPSRRTVIDRVQASKQRVDVDPEASSKPQQQEVIHLDDEDDPIEEFPETPKPASKQAGQTPRRPTDPYARMRPDRPSPGSASTTPLLDQANGAPLPAIPRKGKKKVEVDDSDDEIQPMERPTGKVREKAAALDERERVSQLVAPQRPPKSALAKNLRGKTGEAMAASPPTNARSSAHSRVKPVRDDPEEYDHLSYVAQSWWKGIHKHEATSKASQRIIVAGGSFMLGDKDLEIPFSSILRLRVSKPGSKAFFVSLEHADDGGLDKIIPEFKGTVKRHAFARTSINILFEAGKSKGIYADIRARFDKGERARDSDGSKAVELVTIEEKEGTDLKHLLEDAQKARPPKHAQASPLYAHKVTRSAPAPAPAQIDIESEPETTPAGPSRSRAPKPACVNPTEVLATWPLTGKSQIDITRGDYHRTLDDVEFLNDTMVEYGLRSALAKAIETFPDLESDVHIFSTYLYSKLNAKKKTKEGDPWDVVARWTRKFDLFEKKYVIVPINEDFHWYLAIIVNPAAVLRPAEVKIPPEPKSVTRKQSKGDNAPMDVDPQDSAEPPHAPAVVGASPAPKTLVDAVPEDVREDDEVEDALALATSADQSPPVGTDGPSGRTNSRASNETELVMDTLRNVSLDATEEISSGQRPRSAEKSPDPASPPALQSPDAPATPRTDEQEPGYIFTLDSLGTTHIAAGKLLNRYLASEAKNRKEIDFEPSPLICRKLDVPTQPDFSSCGVYMIHYVECFLRDPIAIIQEASQRDRSKSQAQYREGLWRKDSLPDARHRLRQSVDDLVQAWKDKRAQPAPTSKDEQDVVGESSSAKETPVTADITAPKVESPSERAGASEPDGVSNGVPKLDKGKGREVRPSSPQPSVALSPSKRPNPFARNAVLSPSAAAAAASNAPPSPVDPASPSPAPPDQVPPLDRAPPPEPLEPADRTSSPPAPVVPVARPAIDGFEELSSSESEDHRSNGRALDDQLDAQHRAVDRATSGPASSAGDHISSHGQRKDASDSRSPPGHGSSLSEPVDDQALSLVDEPVLRQINAYPQSMYASARAALKSSPSRAENPTYNPPPLKRQNARRSPSPERETSPIPGQPRSRRQTQEDPPVQPRIASARRVSSPLVTEVTTPVRQGNGVVKRPAQSSPADLPPGKKVLRSTSRSSPPRTQAHSALSHEGGIHGAHDILDQPSPQPSRGSADAQAGSSRRATDSSSSLGVATSVDGVATSLEAKRGSTSRSSNGTRSKPSSRSDVQGDVFEPVVDDADDEADDPMDLLSGEGRDSPASRRRQNPTESRYFSQSKRSADDEEDVGEPVTRSGSGSKRQKVQPAAPKPKKMTKAQERAAEKAETERRSRESEQNPIVLSD